MYPSKPQVIDLRSKVRTPVSKTKMIFEELEKLSSSTLRYSVTPSIRSNETERWGTPKSDKQTSTLPPRRSMFTPSRLQDYSAHLGRSAIKPYMRTLSRFDEHKPKVTPHLKSVNNSLVERLNNSNTFTVTDDDLQIDTNDYPSEDFLSKTTPLVLPSAPSAGFLSLTTTATAIESIKEKPDVSVVCPEPIKTYVFKFSDPIERGPRKRKTNPDNFASQTVSPPLNPSTVESSEFGFSVVKTNAVSLNTPLDSANAFPKTKEQLVSFSGFGANAEPSNNLSTFAFKEMPKLPEEKLKPTDATSSNTLLVSGNALPITNGQSAPFSVFSANTQPTSSLISTFAPEKKLKSPEPNLKLTEAASSNTPLESANALTKTKEQPVSFSGFSASTQPSNNSLNMFAPDAKRKAADEKLKPVETTSSNALFASSKDFPKTSEQSALFSGFGANTQASNNSLSMFAPDGKRKATDEKLKPAETTSSNALFGSNNAFPKTSEQSALFFGFAAKTQASNSSLSIFAPDAKRKAADEKLKPAETTSSNAPFVFGSALSTTNGQPVSFSGFGANTQPASNSLSMFAPDAKLKKTEVTSSSNTPFVFGSALPISVGQTVSFSGFGANTQPANNSLSMFSTESKVKPAETTSSNAPFVFGSALPNLSGQPAPFSGFGANTQLASNSLSMFSTDSKLKPIEVTSSSNTPFVFGSALPTTNGQQTLFSGFGANTQPASMFAPEPTVRNSTGSRKLLLAKRSRLRK